MPESPSGERSQTAGFYKKRIKKTDRAKKRKRQPFGGNTRMKVAVQKCTQRQSGSAKREIRYETDGKDTKRRITRKKKNNTGIPDYELDGIARVFVSAIQKLFDSAEVQQEFNEWKAAGRHSNGYANVKTDIAKPNEEKRD